MNTGSSTSPALGTPTGGYNQTQKSGGLSTGMIVGIAVGGIGFVIILSQLLWWFRRRGSKPSFHNSRPADVAEAFPRTPGSSQPVLPWHIPYPVVFLPQGMNNPDTLFSGQQRQRSPPPPQPQNYDEGSPSSQAAASLVPGSRRAEFIVHRDIDEASAQVELPPHYNDRRTPCEA